jgi:xylulokinase
MQQKYILTIDLGTSGSKAALMSFDGNIAGFAFRETPLYLLPDGGAEQNPDEWWQAVINSSKDVLRESGVPSNNVVAINCTTQWSGTVAVNREGRHLMNAIIWMDSRGESYVRKVVGGPVRIEGFSPGKLLRWIRLTGGAPSPSGKDPLAHILFLKHRHPDIYHNTYKFLEPKNFINLKLTGRFAASYDSITLHWVTDNRNISKVTYNDTLIRMAGIDREKLPDLVPPLSVLGTIRKEISHELGLQKDVTVVCGAPDVQSAAVGSGAVEDYKGHVYIGTSSWLTCHLPFKKTDILHNMACLPSAIPGRYFLANEQETAGACLTFLRDNILYHKDQLLREEKQPDVYKVFDKIAEDIPPGSGRLLFTPWLYGERTPAEDHLLRGGLHNLSLFTTRGHIIRAFLEGVAYNTRWVLQYIEKFIGRKMDPLHMIGGGANSSLWCQIYADVLNRKILQVQDPIQANARGAGLLALAALGHARIEELSGYTKVRGEYIPDSRNRNIYDDLFGEFLAIYQKNKGIYHRLNRPIAEK